MRSAQELAALRERAVQLRRQGKSRRQIKEILGPIRDSTLDGLLRGEPPPEWTRRPNAKDDLHAKARELRARGMDYREIAATLGVSKSSVSLWVRDLPRVGRLSTAERKFRRPTLKRHNPKTVRKKIGEGYHGCLRIDVRRSGGLYRKIEAWAAGIMTGSGRQDGPAWNPSALPGKDSNLR